MRLFLDVEGGGRAEVPGGGADLVALMSFAISRGFGAQHPLIALADRLAATHHVPFGPLTTFYEADPEDSEDIERLDLAWQSAEPLRDSLDALVAAIESDEMACALLRRADAQGLVADARSLAALLTAPAAAGLRARLVYEL